MNGDIYKQNRNWKSGNCSGSEVVKSRDLARGTSTWADVFKIRISSSPLRPCWTVHLIWQGIEER